MFMSSSLSQVSGLTDAGGILTSVPLHDARAQFVHTTFLRKCEILRYCFSRRCHEPR